MIIAIEKGLFSFKCVAFFKATRHKMKKNTATKTEKIMGIYFKYSFKVFSTIVSRRFLAKMMPSGSSR